MYVLNSFYAEDELGAQSGLAVVTMVLCSGCSGHGTCDYSNYQIEDGASAPDLVPLAYCDCQQGFTGKQCENKIDPCFLLPCPGIQVAKPALLVLHK